MDFAKKPFRLAFLFLFLASDFSGVSEHESQRPSF